MKVKNLLLSIICLLVFSISHGQNEFKIGLNLGGTLSSVRGNDIAEENKAALDFLVGASFEYSFNQNTSIISNINYERKSYSQDVDSSEFILDGFDPLIGNGEIKIRSTLSYLSIPIMLKYNFGANKNFFINGGPYIGFFLDSGVKVDGEKVKDDSNDIFNSTDFGLSFGIGTKVKLNETNNLNIELRNNLGLSNISAVAVIDDGTVKTNSINLIFNWEFEL